MAHTPKKTIQNDALLLYLVGAGALIVTVYLFVQQALPEWKSYQRQFIAVVSDAFGDSVAAKVPLGIQQTWVPQLGRTDRCQSCHMGITWKGLERAELPFRTHSQLELLQKHPIAEFGCTICHGGQGYALTTTDAHGDIEHWEEPLLSSELAGSYLISNKQALIQIRCNTCHRYEVATPGADWINHAKDLVNRKGCRACHIINGRGGSIGPDLTNAGGKDPEQFDFSRFSGEFKSVFGWHVAHFKSPKSIAPETIMPDFQFGSRDAQSLTMLMLSWRPMNLPVRYYPDVVRSEPKSPAELALEQAMASGEARFFVDHRCFVCHSVSSFGLTSPTQIGPDLAKAYKDVESRFGKSLEQFLMNPTGTMSVVLSTQIHLTDAEKREAIRLLTEAYRRYEAEQERARAGGK